MDNVKVANELVRLAKSLVSARINSPKDALASLEKVWDEIMLVDNEISKHRVLLSSRVEGALDDVRSQGERLGVFDKEAQRSLTWIGTKVRSAYMDLKTAGEELSDALEALEREKDALKGM